jgi:hypothetical protein
MPQEDDRQANRDGGERASHVTDARAVGAWLAPHGKLTTLADPLERYWLRKLRRLSSHGVNSRA